MAYKYGMIPSVPDSRDRIFQNPSHVPLPASFDLSHWMKPVKNQGNLGSCTGNAYAGIAELQFKKYRNLDGSRGAFHIRNSWGRDWGQSGNFWMPYAYIVNPSYVSDLWVTHFGNWGPTQ